MSDRQRVPAVVSPCGCIYDPNAGLWVLLRRDCANLHWNADRERAEPDERFPMPPPPFVIEGP
jgi:hypothetical protein